MAKELEPKSDERKDVKDGSKPKKKKFKGKGKDKGKGGDKKFDPKPVPKDGENGEKMGGCSINDVNWYVTNPQLLKDVASFSFSNPAGFAMDLGKSVFTNSEYVVPGIAVLKLVPSIGKSKNYASAANIAYVNQYAFIRHANSGARNYEFADLGISQLAVGQLFAYLASLVRIYGVAYTYSRQNRYFGTALLTALGVNPANIINNLAEFRAGLNRIIEKCKFIAVPKDQAVYQRWIFVESSIYVDQPDLTKAQFYLTDFAGYWKWSATDSTHGSSLVYKELKSDNTRTYTELLDFAEELIDAILQDEDCGTIYGDVLKSYGSEALMTISPVAEDYKVLPVYSEEVLLQIQNANMVGEIMTQTMNVTQSQDLNGAIIFDPAVTQDSKALARTSNPVITIPAEVPTPEAVMVSTRLTPTMVYDTDKKLTSLDSFGTEIPVYLRIFTRSPYASPEVYWFDLQNFINITADSDMNKIATIMEQMSKLDKFAFHPSVTISRWTGTSGEVKPALVGFFKDLTNYTVMTYNDLRKLHDVAVMSELYVRTGSVSKS